MHRHPLARLTLMRRDRHEFVAISIRACRLRPLPSPLGKESGSRMSKIG